MEIRKNLGLILIILGILLTLDKTSEFGGMVQNLLVNIKDYWPVLLCVFGLYLVCTMGDKKQ